MTKTEIKKIIKEASSFDERIIDIVSWYDSDLESVMVYVYTLTKYHKVFKDLYRINLNDKTPHYISCEGSL